MEYPKNTSKCSENFSTKPNKQLTLIIKHGKKKMFLKVKCLKITGGHPPTTTTKCSPQA